MLKKTIKIISTFCFVTLLSIGILKGCTVNYSSTFYPPKNYPEHWVTFSLTDSIVKVPAGKQYKKGFLHKLFFGKHYRDVWATPIEVETFDITKEKGGLSVLKKGGNMQTLNLRMVDKEGKEYVLRSVDKDQANALPSSLRKSFIKRLFRDQTSALNPYGALIISPLADAANILHTDPDLFYVTKEKKIKEFAPNFEFRLAILEEFPDETWISTGVFGKPNDIVSTEKLLEERYTDPGVSIDKRLFLRSRLFDILINDWDRHGGQWRWAVYKDKNLEHFKPIARDRDAAFYKFKDGIFPFLASLINPKFQTFDEDYGNLKGLIKNARYVDNLILPELTLNDWIEIADSLKLQITDKLIDSAVQNLPKEVFPKIGLEIACKLKIRRDNLTKAAIEVYEIINKEVTLVSTDLADKITITRDTKNTLVTIHNPDKLMFTKNFDNKITQTINLYTIEGNDSISINGVSNRGIKINLFPGKGDDYIREDSEVKCGNYKTFVYDSPTGNTLYLGKEGKNMTSPNAKLDINRKGERDKEF